MTTAIDCTAKLCAFRKTRDGVVASFVIHPNEVPEKLQTDPIGTSYVMVLVEVDDATGQPKEVMPNEQSQHKRPDTSPRPLPDKPAGGAKKGWDDMSPAQQAGILCNDPAFRKFMTEGTNYADDMPTVKELVCIYCDVTSRREILPSTHAEEQWDDIVDRYRTWQHEPEVVG